MATRRRLRFWTISIAGLISLSVLAPLIWLYYQYQHTNQQNQGVTQLTTPYGYARVNWDDYGVPHIKSDIDDLAVFYALGFVHAQDRLWQMEFQRRVTQGRLSEIFGDKTLAQDEFLRRWGFYRAAQQTWPALNEKTRAIVQSYTRGVNAFLDRGDLPLPFLVLDFKPEPWTEIDSIAWQKMLAFNLQNDWEVKLDNYHIATELGIEYIAILNPPYPSDGITILSENDLRHAPASLPFTAVALNKLPTTPINAHQDIAEQIKTLLNFCEAPGKGSNSWVASGKLTASGKPLLANDVHLGLTAPAVWYLAHLEGPGIAVTGATLPSIPMVIIGHNTHIAWGVTNSYVDTQELYIEPANAELETRTEDIQVRGQAPVTITIEDIDHRPVIGETNDGLKISLKWPALLPGDTTPNSFAALNYAHSWPEFLSAMEDFVSPAQNFIYADIAGNIGYLLAGHIPIRRGWDGALPVNDDAQHQWQGYIPFVELPRVFNPPNDFIIAANNKVVPDNYPYQLTFNWRTQPYRAQRIRTLLQRSIPLTREKYAQIQVDTVSYFWRDIRPYLLATIPQDKPSQFALEQLQTWDGSYAESSQTSVIFAYWLRELQTLTPSIIARNRIVPKARFIKQQLIDNGQYCQTDSTNNCAQFLSQTLQNAMQHYINDLGAIPNNKTWGDIHQANFNYSGLGQAPYLGRLWNRTIAAPGSYFTVNMGAYNSTNFQQTFGATYRQIIDLAELNHSRYILPPGQSQDPLNQHYQDQLWLWTKGLYIGLGDS